MEEIERARCPSPPPAASVAIAVFWAWVLDDDDLLREILLRLVLPTSLLRAALVCKRWYHLASDPAFLRRFHDRNPPRILGVYLPYNCRERPRFLPIRPLPELAAAVRRAESFFDAFVSVSAMGICCSRGDHLVVMSFRTFNEDYVVIDYYTPMHLLCSPLSSASYTRVVPRLPPLQRELVNYCISLPYGGDGRSYFLVWVGFSEQLQQATVYLHEFQQGMGWIARGSAMAQLPTLPPIVGMLLDGSKFYILVAGNRILVCDFASSSITAMELPDGVNATSYNTRLSRRDDSGVHLLHVKESLLRVFRGDNNTGSWCLIHSICLREVCANLGLADDWPSHRHGRKHVVVIRGVGDNAKFVFLMMIRAIVVLDIASKQAEKVHEFPPDGAGITFVDVHPLMLPWPPKFPELKD